MPLGAGVAGRPGNPTLLLPAPGTNPRLLSIPQGAASTRTARGLRAAARVAGLPATCGASRQVPPRRVRRKSTITPLSPPLSSPIDSRVSFVRVTAVRARPPSAVRRYHHPLSPPRLIVVCPCYERTPAATPATECGDFAGDTARGDTGTDGHVTGAAVSGVLTLGGGGCHQNGRGGGLGRIDAMGY